MTDLPLQIGTVAWAIESPFNTLEIICHAANIPQDSRPLVKTTKLVLPDVHPTFCHPQCYNAGSIDYILLTWDQTSDIVVWARHHGLTLAFTNNFWSHIDGFQHQMIWLEPEKSRSKPEKILKGIHKEIEEERAENRRWDKKKSYRPAQIFRRVQWNSKTDFLLSRTPITGYYLRRLRFRLRMLLYYFQNLLHSDLEDDA